MAERTNILSVDIGGTGLKASVVDARGKMLTERLRVETPDPSTPRAVVAALRELVKPLPPFARVAVGFPGVVRNGRVVTAPNLGTEHWRGFDLARALGKLWQRPVRVVNDADMQALGAARGKGLEVMITLGTGLGFGIVHDGQLAAHLELSQIPFRHGETYDEQLGNEARKAVGNRKWNRRVERALANLRTLTNFDTLYVGGGNARHLDLKLPDDVRLVANDCGLKGGAALWR